MEYIQDHVIVKDFLKDNDNVTESLLQVLGGAVGRAVGEMHNVDVIHGDLTTSNLLINPQDIRTKADLLESEGDKRIKAETDLPNHPITLIDFGLAQVSRMTEDRAVDLYVLERAFLSTHSKYSDTLMESVLNGYKAVNNNAKEVLIKYEEVRMRGRKRTMVG